LLDDGDEEFDREKGEGLAKRRQSARVGLTVLEKAHLVQSISFYLENVELRESRRLRERKVSGKRAREEEERRTYRGLPSIHRLPSSVPRESKLCLRARGRRASLLKLKGRRERGPTRVHSL
jgi:hypothetical protein